MSSPPKQHAAHSTGHARSLKISVCRDEAAFSRLADDWNRLADGVKNSSVFLRFEWFDAAWQWAKYDAEMWIVCIADQQGIIGIAPLVRRTNASRLGRAREVGFLTVPDTQYADVLALPCDRAAVFDALMQWLVDTRKTWDTLRLAYLSSESDTIPAFAQRASSKGYRFRIEDQGTNPGIALGSTWEKYYSQRTRRLKKGNNLIANRIKRAGASAEIRRYTPQSCNAAEIAQALETSASLSSKSWKDGLGVSLNHEGPQAWFRRLNQHSERTGWLSVWLLTIDGRPAAMEYQLQYNGRIHGLRSDFDPTLDEFSPGTYLNWKMLEALFDVGAQHYQMGPGNNPYKYRWADTFDPISCLTLYGSTVMGRWLALRDLRLRPLAKRLQSYRKSTTDLEHERS